MATNWRISWRADPDEAADHLHTSAADIRRLTVAARTMLPELAGSGSLPADAAADDVEQAVYLAVLRAHRRLGVSDLIVVDEDAQAALPGYPLAEAGKVLHYPVWIAAGRKEGGWSWGPPCDTAAEAALVLARIMAERPLTPLGTVVAFGGGDATPVRDLIVPVESREVIALWDALEDLAEGLPASGSAPCCWPAWTDAGRWRLGSPERDAEACGRAVVERVRAGAVPGGPAHLAARIAREAPGEPAVAKMLWPPSARKLVQRWDGLWDATDREVPA